MTRSAERRVLAAALAVLAGCAGPGDLSRHARIHRPAPDAAAAWSAANEALTRGDHAAAEAALRDAAASDPDFLPARRALQDLEVATFRRSLAFDEASKELEREPASARAHYLMSRVREGSARERHLERALELDPYYGWAKLGLALYKEEAEGRGAGLELAAEASALLPEEADAAFVHVRVAWGLVRDEEVELLLFSAVKHFGASPNLCEAAARKLLTPSQSVFHPLLLAALERHVKSALQSDGACLALADLVARGAPRSFCQATENALEASRKLGPVHADLDVARARLRAEVLLASNRVAEASLELERALSLGEGSAELRRRLRLTRILNRQYEGALTLERDFRKQFGAAFAAPASDAEAVLFEAGARAASSPRDAGAVFELGRAAAGAGWLDESAELTAQAIALGYEGADAHELLRQVGAARRFFAEMPRILQEDLTPSLSLLPAMAGVREAGVAILGFDPIEGSQVQDFLPLGLLLRADPKAPGLPRFLDRYNFEVRLGKRWIGPVEAFGLRRLGSRDVKGTILGRPYEGREVLGEGASIFTRLEQAGSRFAGSTFPGSVFLVLDPIAAQAADLEYARDVQRLTPADWKRQDLPKALTDSERRAADESWDLGRRLTLAAFERDPSPAAPRLLEIVRLHEYGHMADAEEFLPLARSLHHVVSWLFSAGFSITAIEARLELRAELAALCATRDPELALAEIVRYAPRRAAQLPHSLGFAELTRRFVDAVAARMDRGELPRLERDKAILPQLWKLSAEELREVARELARDEGLVAGAGMEEGSPGAMVARLRRGPPAGSAVKVDSR